MTVTTPTTHVHRGKGSLYCDHCNERIRRGEEYTRQVFIRRGTPRRNDRCYVSIVHVDDEQCLYWLEEEALAEHGYIEAEATVAIPIEVVLTKQLVIKVGVNGEPVIETETVSELKVGSGVEKPQDDDAPHIVEDSDDEIPF